jgi:hypothetical protein
MQTQRVEIGADAIEHFTALLERRLPRTRSLAGALNPVLFHLQPARCLLHKVKEHMYCWIHKATSKIKKAIGGN